MNFKNYIDELKRRHVIKAGIAYLVVAWIIVQVLSIVFPAFKASPNALRTAIIILGIGLPIWLIISWIYDFTPEGIKKTDAVVYDSKAAKKKNIRLNRVIIGSLSIAVILLAFTTFSIKNKLDTVSSKLYANALMTNYSSSIAVLAFEDLSPEKDQAYFADGLSRSIYDRLVRYKKLKVISPTSSFRFKDKDVSIGVIGEELDVSYVLEGSVLKFGDKYRVNINLVNTKDGSAIWSKSYDEKPEDLLYTYDNIAQQVAQYLKLTVEHEDVRLRKVDPEAYILYLKAGNSMEKQHDSTILAAEKYINKSLNIDPTYAPAWSRKSQVINYKSYWRTKLKIDGEEKEGIKAAKKSIELDPEHYSGYLLLSRYRWRSRDMIGFQENLYKVLELAPNNAEALIYSAQCAMRINKLEEARKLLEKARLLDPENNILYMYLGNLELHRENYDEALYYFTRLRDVWANLKSEAHADDYYVALAYYYKGQPEKALEELEKEYFEYYKFLLKCIIFYDMGKLEESDYYLERLKTKNFSKKDWMLYSDAGVYSDIAQIYALRGDKDNAFKYLEKSFWWINHFPEFFFFQTSYRELYDDRRWETILDKLSKEFNYNFNNKP